LPINRTVKKGCCVCRAGRVAGLSPLPQYIYIYHSRFNARFQVWLPVSFSHDSPHPSTLCSIRASFPLLSVNLVWLCFLSMTTTFTATSSLVGNACDRLSSIKTNSALFCFAHDSHSCRAHLLNRRHTLTHINIHILTVAHQFPIDTPSSSSPNPAPKWTR
jgi:hypothetical protein